jgi:hypothetical protein
MKKRDEIQKYTTRRYVEEFVVILEKYAMEFGLSRGSKECVCEPYLSPTTHTHTHTQNKK